MLTVLARRGRRARPELGRGPGLALGVLVDTFVVRSLLVPAIALILGDRSWWPWHLR